MEALFFVAIAIVFGYAGGRVANLVKLPGIIGYLLAGLILGPSFFNVFTFDLLGSLDVITGFALSIVAFMIGSEMKISTLKELGSGIGIITLLESFGAFLLVCCGVYFLTGKLYLGLIFGAMAPASAPAGTVAVLQETRSKGRLTNALYAVVGLDDGLAIMIFAISIALAKMLFNEEAISAAHVFEGPILEIFGAIVLGSVLGLATGYFARKLSGGEDHILAVSLGGILICTGIATRFDFSLILANLSLGMVFVNVYPAANRKACRIIQSMSLPVYIVFFFIAGAHLQVGLLGQMGLIGLVYVFCRIGGLMGGAFLGATISRQSSVLRKYLGLGILSQAGVAIGLSILAAGEFNEFGEAGRRVSLILVNTIMATTIFFEVIGPIGTKIAVTKAGEAGANITEEDLIESFRVSDVMDTTIPVIEAGTSLSEIIGMVSNTNSFYYSVIDNNSRLIGAITLNGIRNTFTTQELNDWLVALDVVEPVAGKVNGDMPLSEAFSKAKRLDVEHLPVVLSEGGSELIGIFDCRRAHRLLSTEVLSRQQRAETIYHNS